MVDYTPVIPQILLLPGLEDSVQEKSKLITMLIAEGQGYSIIVNYVVS